MKITADISAKLNLMLSVTGKRKDGYHLIESVMQSVSLFDTVSVETNSIGNIIVKTNNEALTEDNIAKKAAELYFEKANLYNGADIYIEKRIPVSAGLGGGSADAAAVLLILNRIYEKFSIDELKTIGLLVGADVPFCLEGGTAFVKGIGEQIKRIKDIPNCWFLLVKNCKKSSTKQMYEKIDEIGFSNGNKKIIAHFESGDLKAICSNISNDFYKVCKTTENEEIFRFFKSFNPLGYGLSGAGPTVFAVFDDYNKANKLYDQLKSKVEFATVCQPTQSSIKFID